MLIQRMTIVPKQGQGRIYLDWVRKHTAKMPKYTPRWLEPISGRRDVVILELEFADWAAHDKWWTDWFAWHNALPPSEQMQGFDYSMDDYYEVFEIK